MFAQNKKVLYFGVKKKYLTLSGFPYMIYQVSEMNEILKQALLYDFYGELLTDRQKEIYEQFILDDLSLGEIAQGAGISRQGVHDSLKRCNKTLAEYEEKLHLVEKFVAIKGKISQINEMLERFQETERMEFIHRIREISDEILEEL